MTTHHAVTIEVEVRDPQDLYAAALKQLVADGIAPEDAATTIGTADDPNIGACLVMILDPGSVGTWGCITNSSAEQY